MNPTKATGPLLSVIIPSHNVEPWIDELLSSVLEQTLDDLEVIVVDDHSTDATPERLAELASLDPRILLVEADGRGGAGARNLGLAVAAGRYVAFADADDIVPPDAYRALVHSLESSGSDIAFGDFLKFSSTTTWQPSKNWRSFEEDRQRIRLTDEPNLIMGRAVWNKVFRRSFLAEIGLAFPEVVRSNDIMPMTTAYVRAQLVDIVSDCVYLYRDRPGVTSMTARAGASAAAASYFGQEAACASLISDVGDEGLSAVFSALVFDADSWVHLSRFLASVPADEAINQAVIDAIDALVTNTPRRGLKRATPHKQILWGLLADGHLDLARRFNAAEEIARPSASYDAEALRLWAEALRTLLVGAETAPGIDQRKVYVDGFLTQLAHHAHGVSDDDLARVFAELGTEATGAAGPWRIANPVLGRVQDAVVAGDTAALRAISAHRSTPLVADSVASVDGTATLKGPIRLAPGARLKVVAHQPASGARVELGEPSVTDDRWSLAIPVAALSIARWELIADFGVGDLGLEQPVVTARMPLPEVSRADRIRVLSDRTRRWRVILDVRPTAAARAVSKMGRRVLPRARG